MGGKGCAHVWCPCVPVSCSGLLFLCLAGGFSTRPFVRSVQRQSLSSRSSVTSPLVVSENGIRPSWSLSAKLQMRSNSPSRFPGDSPVHSSASTLERIGESTDAKITTSGFGSPRSLSGSYLEPGNGGSTRQEHRPLGRAPLAVMEGVFRDEVSARKSSVRMDSYSKNAVQAERTCSALDPFDNNNQIAFVDQSDSVESSPVKEGRSFSGLGITSANAEGTPPKAASSKGALELDKNVNKGRIVPSSPDSLPSSPPPTKNPPKFPRSQSKLESSRVSGRHGSPAAGQGRAKDGGSKALEATPSPSSQQKQKSVSSSSSAATRRNSSGSSVRSHTPAGKSRTSERGLSRDGSKQSLGSDRVNAATSSRTSSPRVSQSRSEGKTSDGKHVRSSSMASLRSPTAGPRSSLKRDSKSEDKGLSFFKSALRQKETRRSADLGKTTLLAKKVAGSSSKAAGEKLLDKSSPQASRASPTAKGAPPAKHSLLTNRRSKSSQLEATPQSPGGKQAADTQAASHKLPASMSSAARSASKPQ